MAPKLNLKDFYGFIANKLLEASQYQPQEERHELQNVIQSAFLRRSLRKQDFLEKLDEKHHWIAQAISEGQSTWERAHDGVLPTDLLKGENAANLLNLENALTGNYPENFSDSGNLVRK